MTAGKLFEKVVTITGGNSGIGRAAAILFAREGAKVVIGARDPISGEAVVSAIQMEGCGDPFFVKTDVSKPEDVANLVNSAVSHFGRLDVILCGG